MRQEASDLRLLKRWQSRQDAEAFNALVNRHAGLVFSSSLRVLRNTKQAEDIAQACFIRLAHRRVTIRSSVAAWLHQLATHRSLDLIKQEAKRRERERRYVEIIDPTADGAWEALQPYIDDAISKLSDKHREVIIAHFLEGRSHTSIAQELGVGRSTVSDRIKQGVEQLRILLKKAGIQIAGPAMLTVLGFCESKAVPSSVVSALGRISLLGTARTGPARSSMTGLLAVGASVAAVVGLVIWQTTNHEGQPGPERQSMVHAAQQTRAESAPSGGSALEFHILEQRDQDSIQDTNADPRNGRALIHMGTTIRGRVYDARTGKGIAADRIICRYQNGPPPLFQYPCEDRPKVIRQPPDENGQYLIQGLAEGSYAILPMGVKHYPQPTDEVFVTVTNGQVVAGIDFALERVLVSGRVVDREGNPAPHATVGARVLAGRGETVTADAQGNFAIGLASGGNDFVIRAATSNEVSPLLGPMLVTEEGSAGLEIPLTESRTSSIQGVVVDDQGKPVPHQRLRLVSMPSTMLIGEGRTVSEKDGTFYMDALYAGEYALRISGRGTTKLPIVLDEGETKTDVRVVRSEESPEQGSLEIAGWVVDSAGDPISDAHVSSGFHPAASSWTDEAGRFRLGGLTDQIYPVLASHSAYTTRNMIHTAAGTTNLEIMLLGTATMSGRILDAENGEPITEYELHPVNELLPYVDPETDYASPWSRNVSDALGAFALQKVRAGDYSLIVRARNFAPGLFTFQVKEDEPVEGLELALERVQPLLGRVVASNDEPVHGARIFLGRIPPSSRILRQAVAVSDNEGAFSIDSYIADARTLSAWHPEYGPGMAEIAGRTTEIVMPPAGTLTGMITVNGRPQGKPHVTLQYVEHPGQPGAITAAVDEFGEYALSSLGEGLAKLHVALSVEQETRTLEHLFIIEDGSSSVLNIDFAYPSSAVEGRITRDRAPYYSCVVRLDIQTASGTERFIEKSDRVGFYRFDAVPPGPATVRVRNYRGDDRGRTHIEDIDIPDGEVVACDIDIHGNGSIHGHAHGINAGQEVEIYALEGNIPIQTSFAVGWLSQLVNEFAVYETRCADDGSFYCSRLPAGTYTLLMKCRARRAYHHDYSYASTVVGVPEAGMVWADLSAK